MPRYIVELVLNMGTGDELEVDAVDEDIARKAALLMANERFHAGAYDKQISLNEVCVSGIYPALGQEEPTLRVITPVEHALVLLTEWCNELQPYAEHEEYDTEVETFNRLGTIIRTLKGANS